MLSHCPYVLWFSPGFVLRLFVWQPVPYRSVCPLVHSLPTTYISNVNNDSIAVDDATNNFTNAVKALGAALDRYEEALGQVADRIEGPILNELRYQVYALDKPEWNLLNSYGLLENEEG